MSRRKLCVVCAEGAVSGVSFCMACARWWDRGGLSNGSIMDVVENVARRVRAFERRRWKVKAETMPVKVVRRNTCDECRVTVAGRLPKGWYRVNNSGRPFTLCTGCRETAR